MCLEWGLGLGWSVGCVAGPRTSCPCFFFRILREVAVPLSNPPPSPPPVWPSPVDLAVSCTVRRTHTHLLEGVACGSLGDLVGMCVCAHALQIRSNKLLEEALTESPGDPDFTLALTENDVIIKAKLHKIAELTRKINEERRARGVTGASCAAVGSSSGSALGQGAGLGAGLGLGPGGVGAGMGLGLGPGLGSSSPVTAQGVGNATGAAGAGAGAGTGAGAGAGAGAGTSVGASAGAGGASVGAALPAVASSSHVVPPGGLYV